MRVMVFVKATKDSEANAIPKAQMAEMMREMERYNDELREAGVMIECDGLTPSSQGKRVAFDGAGRSVVDGPFGGDLVAGYWLWNVKDMDEAVAWVKRCPNPMPGHSEIEIRPIDQVAGQG
jgi:hypothetical protein